MMFHLSVSPDDVRLLGVALAQMQHRLATLSGSLHAQVGEQESAREATQSPPSTGNDASAGNPQ